MMILPLSRKLLSLNHTKAYNIVPEKLEYIGHAQKRMGTRLCNIVKSHKGTNKTLHGRNKLTESVINSM